MKVVNIVHIVAGAGLLVVLNPKYYSEEVVTKWRWLFAVMGAMIAGYHLFKFSKNPQRWIYLFHALFVAPTILLLGFFPKVAHQVLQLVACAMIAFHVAIVAGIL